MGELATSAVIGLLVSVAGFSLFLRSRLSREQVRIRPELESVHAELPTVTGPLIETLSGILPGRAASRETLARELREAGFYRPDSLKTYLSSRVVMVVVPIIHGLAAALFLPEAWVGQAIGAGIAVALLGFSLPRAYIRSKGRKRLLEIERALPISVDLLTLGLVAGQGLSAAIARTSRELSRPYPALAEELKITMQLADFHGLDHALGLLAGRVPGNEVRNLTLILRQANRLGSDAARALTEFTNDFRVTMRQRAEAQANRLGFLMLFPTIFCLLVAAAIILIGPAYFEFWQGRADTSTILNGAASELGPR